MIAPAPCAQIRTLRLAAQPGNDLPRLVSPVPRILAAVFALMTQLAPAYLPANKPSQRGPASVYLPEPAAEASDSLARRGIPHSCWFTTEPAAFVVWDRMPCTGGGDHGPAGLD